MNKIEWSELPHSIMEATQTYHSLVTKGLAIREGTDFGHTKLGASVIAYANKKGMWRKPPPPESGIVRD